MTQDDSASQSRRAAATYRQNPAPKDAYRITMTLKDAPGPFAHIQGLAQFDVVTPECLPPPKHNPGGHTSPVPTEGVEIPLQKTGENTWSGVVYADQMLDEDYHGEGVCKWKLIQAQVQLKATGHDPAETTYVPMIMWKDIRAESPVVSYFNRMWYPKMDGEGEYVSFGETDRSKFGPTLKDADLFQIILSASREAR